MILQNGGNDYYTDILSISRCYRLPMAHSQPNAPGSLDEPRRKAVLFCQDCDHESPIDGNWLIRTQDNHRLYICPDCRHVLTDRPRSSDSPSQSSTPVAHLVGAVFRFWLTPTYWCRSRSNDPDSIETGARPECCA